METVALSVKDAELFLKEHARHYKVPVEAICAIGLGEYEPVMVDVETKAEAAIGISVRLGTDKRLLVLHGAAILGRRADGDAELAHIYVDGTFQGYSILYGACWRALKALGYKRAWL